MDALRLPAGDPALDVGCETGDEVRALAEHMGRYGRAVGVDLGENLLPQARQRTPAESCAEFISADAQVLPSTEGMFGVHVSSARCNTRTSQRGGAGISRVFNLVYLVTVSRTVGAASEPVFRRLYRASCPSWPRRSTDCGGYDDNAGSIDLLTCSQMISVAGARTLTEETGHHSLATVGI